MSALLSKLTEKNTIWKWIAGWRSLSAELEKPTTLAPNGRQLVQGCYSPATIEKALCELYHEIFSNPSKSPR